MSNLRPVGARIIIKEVVAKESLQGGIYVGKTQENIKRGEVLLVGTKDIPEEIQPGKIVLVDYLGGAIDFEGTKVYLLDVEHVVAVIE